MTRFLIAPFVLIALACEGNAQQGPTRPPLPACEWCGADEAPSGLSSEITIASKSEPGDRLTLTGIVFQADGRTPARGVLIYAYHTNAKGVYPQRGDETGNARRHGYLRGWLQTGPDGRYTIHTIRPAAYPGRSDPAHIHLTIRPAGGIEDYIDAVEFADDPLLTAGERARREGRGGPGIVTVRRENGVLRATRDIVLPGGGSGPVSMADEDRGMGAEVVMVGGFSKPADTLVVDTEASIVRWKGTKFRGLGKHEGVVRLGQGFLVLQHGGVTGGAFTMDMRTIQVTDIPVTDPVPRNRLTNHLKDEDFFWVDRHPTSTFLLRSVRPRRDGHYTVGGVLTMRGVARPVEFSAILTQCRGGEVRVESTFEIDRHDWGISFRGSRLTNDLVDDDIALGLVLVARSRQAGVSSAGVAAACNNLPVAGIRS
jgi:protocatechuate 3,4-dioxygenase beta subunit